MAIDQVKSIWASLLEANEISTPRQKQILILGSNTTALRKELTNLTQEEDGLTFSFFSQELKDDEDGTVEIGLYSLSNDPSFRDLIKAAITADTIEDTAIVIYVDWTDPSSFLDQITRWLSILEAEIEEIRKHKKDLIARLMVSIESHIRFYKAPDVMEPGAIINFLVPLSDGVLTRNLGMPIVVVCGNVSLPADSRARRC